MNKKWFVVLIWFGLLLLTACTNGKAESVEESGSNSLFTATARKYVIPTMLPTATRRPIPTMRATITPSQIPLGRQVLISYLYNGNDSMPFRIGCLKGLNNNSFLLFEDGQLIIYAEDRYMEKTLTQGEIDELMAEIESAGLFMLENEEDIFADIPPDISLFWHSWVQFKVKAQIFIYDLGQADYLVDAVTKAINIVRNYQPDGLTPYLPEEVYIWVQPYNGFDSDMEFGKPDISQLSWSDEPIIIDQLGKHAGGLSDEELSFILQEFGKVPVNQLVEQNGQVYQIMVCPKLPN